MIEAEDPQSEPLLAVDLDVNYAEHEDFASFYEREVRCVVGLAYVLSGSRTAAEDLAQEAFLAAFRHWNRVHAYEHSGAWVRRVVANRAVSAGRRRLTEAKVLLRLGGQPLPLPELSEPNEQLWQLVRRLPKRQAQTIALRYLDGCAVAEIAEILQLSEPTVKTHLQRAHRTLAEKYQEDNS